MLNCGVNQYIHSGVYMIYIWWFITMEIFNCFLLHSYFKFLFTKLKTFFSSCRTDVWNINSASGLFEMIINFKKQRISFWHFHYVWSYYNSSIFFPFYTLLYNFYTTSPLIVISLFSIQIPHMRETGDSFHWETNSFWLKWELLSLGFLRT